MSATSLIEVEDLVVEIGGRDPIRAVDSVSFALGEGDCLGLVGESGCGKTMTLRALLGLLPPFGRIVTGEVRMAAVPGEKPVRTAPERLRGGGVSMVFQEPAAALNPTLRVGRLVAEGLRARGAPRRAAREGALELLREVGIPDPERCADAWPHQLSSGLRRRAMIAVALSAEPRLLLCDEPTAALDVTIQDQILTLLDRLRAERGLAVVLVSHDLAVVSRIADRIAVMYAGAVVEEGRTALLLASPRHPYTRALLEAVPDPDSPPRRLEAISGRPPDPTMLPPGCRFAPRCPLVEPACEAARPPLVLIEARRATACRRHGELAKEQRR
jgi:oligopeptide/dipeptide ABC transporter ATP-binding protein